MWRVNCQQRGELLGFGLSVHGVLRLCRRGGSSREVRCRRRALGVADRRRLTLMVGEDR